MKLYLKLAILSLLLIYISFGNERAVSAAQITDANLLNENKEVIMITNKSDPDKLIYSRGEQLDLKGLVVNAYYIDGTYGPVTGYEIIGYDSNVIGNQTVMVLYKNRMDTFTVTVLPEKPANVSIQDNGNLTVTLSWDQVLYASRYDIYVKDTFTGKYIFLQSTASDSITISNPTGVTQSYRIKAVVNVLGVEFQSELSDDVEAVTAPGAVTKLKATDATASTIQLSWSPVDKATGYMVYRSPAGKEDYILLIDTTDTGFIDTGLKSATGYKYKVCAYTYSYEYTGEFSPVLDTSTNPAKPTLKFKAGEGKVRLTWSAVTGASSYNIYIADSNSGYKCLTTITGSSAGSYIAENLITDESYQFYITACRLYNGNIYESQGSDIKTVYIAKIDPTSTTAKLYPTEEDFYNSWTYKKLTNFFSQYVNYSKSIPIPGLISTNVGGFVSTRMCPQGLTFANDYLLMSAYDLAAEENSVIYVISKESKELLTTLILPGKPHAGGLAFDGTNLWITIGSRVAAVSYSDIDTAANSREAYAYVNYKATVSVSLTASFAAYYDGKLWVGSYNELQSTNMYSYIIEDTDTSPVFTKADTILMPNRVQGIAFTDIGTLIISRSCQTNSTMRGYMRQLDIYKPDYTQDENGVISLGQLVNSVTLPSMNEGIAISGNYLYVTYETGVFEDSVYKMDYITAFKLTDVVKKKEN